MQEERNNNNNGNSNTNNENNLLNENNSQTSENSFLSLHCYTEGNKMKNLLNLRKTALGKSLPNNVNQKWCILEQKWFPVSKLKAKQSSTKNMI